MKFIKLYEAYFDNSDSLFESISTDEFVEFDGLHTHEKFTNSEINEINSLFKCKLEDYNNVLFVKDTDDRTTYLSPIHAHKYVDGWFIFVFSHIHIPIGSTLPVILFDGMEGVRDFKNRMVEMPRYPFYYIKTE